MLDSVILRPGFDPEDLRGVNFDKIDKQLGEDQGSPVYIFTLLLPFFPSQNIHFDIYRELVKIAPVIPDEVRRLGAHGSASISAKVCEFGVIDILLTG